MCCLLFRSRGHRGNNEKVCTSSTSPIDFASFVGLMIPLKFGLVEGRVHNSIPKETKRNILLVPLLKSSYQQQSSLGYGSDGQKEDNVVQERSHKKGVTMGFSPKEQLNDR